MKRKGFTLIELSIVLLIVGLLIGGIISGKSLIINGKVRATIRDLNFYKSIINTFYDTYGYFPGDLPNASSYWSGASNGTGNRTIACSDTTPPPLPALPLPPAPCDFAWQHLYYADLMGGPLSGCNSGPVLPVSQKNISISEAAIAGAIIAYTNNLVIWQTLQTYLGTGVASLTSRYGISGVFIGGAYVAPVEQIYQIDMRMDDGIPSTGKILATSCINGACNCVTQTNYSTTINPATYTGNSVYNLKCTQTGVYVATRMPFLDYLAIGL